jgi:undecaprenyl-diphosphatase
MARLHARTGLSGDEAVAAVTLRALASGIAGIIVASLAAATLGLDGPSVPGGAAVPLVVATLLVGAAALALACPHRRGRFAVHLRRTGVAVGGVLSRPWRTLALVLGAVGVVGSQLLILDGAVRAVGGDVGLGALLVTLLGSSAARAAVPSPGGVGPVEAALVAGLAALGMPMAAAAVAVGVYRTAGLWLPVLAGVLALRRLRVLGLL